MASVMASLASVICLCFFLFVRSFLILPQWTCTEVTCAGTTMWRSGMDTGEMLL